MTSAASAGIAVGGDSGEVVPDRTTWSSTTTAQIGVSSGGLGTLTVDGGSVVQSKYGHVGYATGASGSVTVTGSGSKWANSSYLYVGYSGSGSLSVEAGAQVTNTSGYLGYSAGSTGCAILTGSGSKWTNSGYLYIGSSGNGTLSVQAGAQVSNSFGYLGYNAGSTGGAVVSGSGSKWTNSADLRVGSSGVGTLCVEAGAQVSNDLAYLGYNVGSTGSAIITGSGSKWTNSGSLYIGNSGSGRLTVSDGGLVSANTLWACLSDLHGNGTLTAQAGAVLDADLRFDASHGTTQTLTFGSGGTLQVTVGGTGDLGVGYKQSGSLRIAEGCSVSSLNGYLGYNAGSAGSAIVSGAGSKWANAGGLDVGCSGSAMLTVAAGAQVSSTSGNLGGYSTASIGSAVVTGAGSKWANSSSLYVGGFGRGSLSVEAGAQVTNTTAYLGYKSDAAGSATVTGVGSKWANSSSLYVGYAGHGTLSVSDGGQVTAKSLSIDSVSSVNLHVSGNDMLVMGNATTTGALTNNGKINLYADSSLMTGMQYSPITDFRKRAIIWTGSGTCSAFGGTWDQSARTFTVAPLAGSAAGHVFTFAAGVRRLLIVDGGAHQSVGASFGTVADGTTFAASIMTPAELTSLAAGDGQSPLAAWDFSTSLPAGQPVVLSFAVGEGASNLQVWHSSGGIWSAYAPADLQYDNGVASFTVTGFSGYAVTGAVPEPASLCVVLLGLGAVALRRSRRNDAMCGAKARR